MGKRSDSSTKLAELLDVVAPKPLDEAIDKAIADATCAIAVDMHTGIIVQAKPLAEELFGYGPGELKGMSIHDLLPERLRENHKYWVGEYAKNPVARSMGNRHMNLRGLYKNGHEFPVEIGLSYADLGEMKVAIANIISMSRIRNGAALLVADKRTDRDAP